jgi:hypothetical protein
MKKTISFVLGLMIFLVLVGSVIAQECIDSDDGVDYVNNGTVEIRVETGSAYYHDTCSIYYDDILVEYSCNQHKPALVSEIYTCEYGCRDGACLVDDTRLKSELNWWQRFVYWLKNLFS